MDAGKGYRMLDDYEGKVRGRSAQGVDSRAPITTADIKAPPPYGPRDPMQRCIICSAVPDDRGQAGVSRICLSAHAAMHAVHAVHTARISDAPSDAHLRIRIGIPLLFVGLIEILILFLSKVRYRY